MRLLHSVAAVFAVALSSTFCVAAPVPAPSNDAAEAPPRPRTDAEVSFRLAPGTTPAVSLRLEAVRPEAIEKVRHENSVARHKRLQIGIGREIALASREQPLPQWTPAPGGMAAHWQVTSAGARALRVELEIASLPTGTELRFGGSGSSVVYGPATAAELARAGSAYWSPVLEGETAIIEVFIPDGAMTADFSFEPTRLSHLFVSLSDPKAEQLAKASEPCEVDFVCRAASDSALAQTGRSVARMSFTSADGGSSLCTGTLLNPADNSFTPYFITAGHCINTQASASTLTTHWFYERAGCGTGATNPSYTQVAGGAQLLYAHEVEDIAFMRLNASPPAAAVFAGWDAAPISSSTAVTAIHHPAGDLKKVSLGAVTSLGPSSVSGGNSWRVHWNSIATGVTEPGSSGSGIFSGNASSGYRFRGTLHGGASSCTATTANLYDDYSRFDLQFAYFAQYLSPGSEPAAGPNVLINPGFESGSRGWTETSSGGAPIITSDAAIARSGSGFAWLGGNVSLTDSLHQDIQVPAGLARLQFWYRITTNETVSGVYDTMTVAVVSPSSGATLSTLETFSNRTTTVGWVQSPVYDLSAFGGQTVRLRFAATNDFSDFTSFRIDDVSVAGTFSATPANYTALWWNPAESGWGINVNHQGDVAFGTLFTYDAAGLPMWLVMSGGTRQGSSDTFTGDLYRTTGPVFNANPFTPIGAGNLTRVGSMTLEFSGPNVGSLSYSVNGVNVSKSIQRQVYGAAAADCRATTRNRSAATHYQDLWWNPAESGWGINITHQGNTLFGTLFTYGSNSQGLWLVMSSGTRQTDGSYLGDLYRTSGPAFDAQPWTGISLTKVGTMRLRFSNGDNGTLEYSVDGVNVTKSITRQVFSSPLPLCSS